MGGVIRIISSLAGINDISGKIIGTRNPSANAFAVLEALLKVGEISEKYESF